MLLAYWSNAGDEAERDKNLWMALKGGEREALAELFRKYHVRLYNYGIKIIADRELVNDAIQKLFLTLWKRHSHLSEANSVKAYLISALRRQILKEKQQVEARGKRNRSYFNKREEFVFSVEDFLISREIAEEKRQCLKEAIEALTPRQKEAIFLKFYHGLSNREIMGVMDINYQCVRNLVYDALRSLRSGVEAVQLRLN